MTPHRRPHARTLLGSALGLVLIASALLWTGVPGASAADPTPTPSPSGPSSTSSPSTSATPSPSPSATPGEGEDKGSTRLSPQAAGAVISASLAWQAVRDNNRDHRVDAGDTVPYVATVANVYGSVALTGITASSTRTGTMTCAATTLAVGARTTCTGTATVGASDVAAAKMTNTLTVKATGAATVQREATPVPVSDCSYNAPATSDQVPGTYFNRPYGTSAQQGNIRSLVVRAINATPQCQKIVISVYSISDPIVINALINAWHRGVDVKVIANSHMLASSEFKRLVRTIGSSTLNSSWVRVCSGSCRGTGGNHHDKMYLFSQAHNSRWVTMMGSHNSTVKAVEGQWNHIDVYNDQTTWDTYYSMFTVSARDQAPTTNPYREFQTGAVNTWFFPRPGTTAATDPMMRTLSGIQCGGVAPGYGVNGRTLIRIGMYAWYDARGIWLAQRVRALWNAGCDVAIEYAVIGNTVKQILYSPAGRGRIPMRQVTTSSSNGTILNYTHEKYVTVSGHQYSYPNMVYTATGTTNWADLGFASDDTTQVWHDAERARRYRADFYSIWRGPKAHVPSPTSALPGKVGTGAVTFGKGKYRNLETN